MKRLYIAAALLVAVVTLCALTHWSHHRQLDAMLATLDRIESLHHSGDTTGALQEAEVFAESYRRLSNRISFYVPHGEVRESQETAALLPALLRAGSDEEWAMEITRLRAQLEYLRQVDDPLPQNIL